MELTTGPSTSDSIEDVIRTAATDDCSIEIETNACSVPWRLIGETVRGGVAFVASGCAGVINGTAVRADGGVVGSIF